MRNVLVVEDNELNLKLFHDLLLIQKHNVIISKDGIGITELVLKEKPDLILMDIQINKVSGIDLIRELKANIKTRHIPIIAITALAMESDKADIYESGCDMYLTKPVSINTFFKSVDHFINPSSHTQP